IRKVATMTIGARSHRYVLAGCFGFLAAMAWPSGAQEARLPTADEIKTLHAKFQSERDDAIKSGAAKRFLPILMEKAEELAKKGEAALASGRLLQASEALRQARWQLPYQTPQGPKDFVGPGIGNLRLRHGQQINAGAVSPH